MTLSTSPTESLLFKEIKEMVKTELANHLESTKTFVTSTLESFKQDQAKETPRPPQSDPVPTPQSNNSLKESIMSLLKEELSTFSASIRNQLLNEMKPKLHEEVKNSLIKTFIESKNEATLLASKKNSKNSKSNAPSSIKSPSSTAASNLKSTIPQPQLPVSTSIPTVNNNHISNNKPIRYTAPLANEPSSNNKLVSPVINVLPKSNQLALTPTTLLNTIHNAKTINSHINGK